ncbi:EAL domain-containing protein [Pseudomaricurvus alcaniphilus]|uniref:EAL domain-containing protein n=1 Tax=Pseudomaricurvus alcaniphilus TaxID=1166482 RepID=UPI00140793B0|nr:EAL domain-containing protein [Pseudomaricurvus alcaniphilus]
MTEEDRTQLGLLLEQAAAEHSDMVLGVRADGSMYYASASIEAVLGYCDRDFLRLYNHSLDFEDDQRFLGVRQFIYRQLEKLNTEMQTGYACEPETLAINHRDGFRVSLSVQCIPSLDDNNTLQGAVCICRDISARKHRVDDVALASAVFENTMIGIYVTDSFGKIIQTNSTFTRITGYQPEEVIGDSPRLIDVERYAPTFLRAVRQSLENNDGWEGEIQHRHKDGHAFTAWSSFAVLRDANRKIVNTIGYFSDLTERRSTDMKIHRLAYFDPLTGLPNGNLFTDRLQQAMFQTRRRGGSLALLVLDLDSFRGVNDRLGHAVGDALLQQVSRRIADCIRAEDTLAHLDEDKFAVILGSLPEGDQGATCAAQVAEKIRQALAQAFVVGNQQLYSGASIGIASYPADGSDPTKLQQHAETALILAKANGKTGYQFYTPSLDNKVRQQRQQEKELLLGFKSRQFEVHYQPVLAAATGVTVACEALLCWRHPKRGLLPAREFIALAASAGILETLGEWVLRQACAQWRQWQHSSAEVAYISVNLTGRQLASPRLLPTLRELFADAAMPAAALQLELTEQMLLQNPQRAMETLDELKRLGVLVSLTSFGSGYSSLVSLNRYPIDKIQIDRSFITDLRSAEDQRLLQGIVALGKSLQLKVGVVGIETPAQRDFVRRIGCDEMQGYLFSAPWPQGRGQIQALG